ncbi:sugar transferase [Paenibacillus sp. y28]|uniref:sugar transferase n=1 Tax=Paenibacillus sp. y28 TaxID=3129110 RepID=UPI00301AFF48
MTSHVQVAAGKKYLIAKRLLDIVGAGIGLVIAFPVIAALAVIIKIEDPRSSVFFKQVRVGRNGQTFHMYKFRSMISGAEDMLKHLLVENEASGPLFKMKRDPRVTRVGRIIRKTSLDELPQLWNVIRGDMSLVGPRPALPREVAEYSLYHKQRLLVIPGLTGLWQVSGRSSLGFQEMVELDLLYIQNRSIWFDLHIILKTFGALSGSKDAY